MGSNKTVASVLSMHYRFYMRKQAMLRKLLLARRIELGLSQEMVGRRVGVLRSTVSKWENNKIKGESPITTIHKISVAYGLTKVEIVSALSKAQSHTSRFLSDRTRKPPNRGK